MKFRKHFQVLHFHYIERTLRQNMANRTTNMIGFIVVNNNCDYITM
jgi:hypothetical protein